MNDTLPRWAEQFILSGFFTVMAWSPTEIGQELRAFMVSPIKAFDPDLWATLYYLTW